MNYTIVPSKETINATVSALHSNNIEAVVVASKSEVLSKIKELIPEGAEVMTMTSVTLDECGVSKFVDESGYYSSVRKQLSSMDRETQSHDMQMLGAAPHNVLGSVHAVTQDGKVLVASNTGSQLPAYSYGSSNVIWVVGAQKIVADLDAGIERIYNYVLPKESVRVQSAYGMKESFVSKLLIINREVNPGRVKMIIVEEALGF